MSLCQSWPGRSGAGTFASQFFRDLVTMAAVGGARPETTLLPGAQAALPHEPGNPVLATAMTQLAEIEPHARATIGVSALFKALNDQGSQFDVFFATLTVLFAAMRDEPAFADIEGLGQSIGGILMLELFHHREACAGISAEQMPKAFFKMSRCRLTYSSSCRRRRSSRCSGVSKASVLGSLSIWPSSARRTQCPSDHLETPRSRATSVIVRPPRTSATALLLNSRS